MPLSAASLNNSGLGIAKSRFVPRSLSDSSDEEEDASEPNSLLDMNGTVNVCFTAEGE